MFHSSIKKVCKSVAPEFSISKNALHTFNTIVLSTAQTLSKESKELYLKAKKSTLSSRDVQSAVRLVFPPEMTTRAVSYATIAVTKFTSSAVGKKAAATDRKRKEVKANLLFSVSKVLSLLKVDNKRVSKSAPVYMAAALEYLCTFIVKTAMAIATEAGKKTFKNSHILSAINDNAELKSIISKQSIVLTAGIALEKKAPKKKREEGAEGKKRRFHPGTVAARNVKRLQKTDGLLLQKAPFKAFVKSLFTEKHIKVNKVHLAKTVCENLQAVVEAHMVELLKMANALAEHADKKTVGARDFNLVYKMTHKGDLALPEKIAHSAGMCNNSIGRLAARGGIVRKSAKIYDAVNVAIWFMGYQAIRMALNHTQHRRAMTITTDDLSAGLKDLGIVVNINN